MDKKMKAVFVVLVVLSLCAAVAVVGLIFFAGSEVAQAENPQPKNDAKQTVEAALAAYQAGKLEAYADYFADKVYGSLNVKKLAAQAATDPASMQKLVEAVGKNTQCSIAAVEVGKDGKQANASVAVVPVDFGKLLQKKTSEVAQNAGTGKYKGLSEEDLFALIFTEVAKDCDKAKKRPKQTVAFKMSVDETEVDPLWKFDEDTLVAPTCGGLLR